MKLAGFLRVAAQWSPADFPMWRYLCRALKLTAACLLFGQAAAYSQSAGTSPSVAPVSSSSTSATTSAGATLPKTIPFKQDSAIASEEGSPSLAAVALVVALGLAGFALWAWRNQRRAGPQNTGKRSNWWGTASSRDVLVHGTTRLSPKHSVHDIEWRGRRLLIGCSEQNMTLLSEREATGSPVETPKSSEPGRALQEVKP